VPGGRREGDTETDGRKKKETNQKHIPERKGVCLLFGFRTFADFLLSFVAFLLSWRSPHKRLDCYRWLPGRIFRPSDTFHFLASFLTKYTPHTYRQPPKLHRHSGIVRTESMARVRRLGWTSICAFFRGRWLSPALPVCLDFTLTPLFPPPQNTFTNRLSALQPTSKRRTTYSQRAGPWKRHR